jgi:acyl dehydratase
VTQEAPSLITDEMKASIGREGPPSRSEVDKTGIRMFARSVGHTDPIFYDEEAAKARGYKSLVCPPGYLGTGVFNPARAGAMAAAMGGGPGAAGPGGRRMRVLNGGTEYEYTAIPICAGDVLTSVGKTVSIEQVGSSLGQMVITRRESTYTNQDGKVVARSYGTSLNY